MTWLSTISAVFEAQATKHAVPLPLPAGEQSFKAQWSDQAREFIHPYVLAEVLLTVRRVRDVATELDYGTFEAALTGNPNLTFTAATKTVTRDAGSFLDDGFMVGMMPA